MNAKNIHHTNHRNMRIYNTAYTILGEKTYVLVLSTEFVSDIIEKTTHLFKYGFLVCVRGNVQATISKCSCVVELKCLKKKNRSRFTYRYTIMINLPPGVIVSMFFKAWLLSERRRRRLKTRKKIKTVFLSSFRRASIPYTMCSHRHCSSCVICLTIGHYRRPRRADWYREENY